MSISQSTLLLLFYYIAYSARCQWAFENSFLYSKVPTKCFAVIFIVIILARNCQRLSEFYIYYYLRFVFYFLSICASLYCQQPDCIAFQVFANFILYTAINVAGMYTKYLTDRGQRLAFIETHKAMEHKKESEKELQRTQKLLDSSE